MQKHVNLIDLVKSFPTSIYLQKSASIQPRTSRSKFGGDSFHLFIRLLDEPAEQATCRLLRFHKNEIAVVALIQKFAAVIVCRRCRYIYCVSLMRHFCVKNLRGKATLRKRDKFSTPQTSNTNPTHANAPPPPPRNGRAR